MGRVKQFELVPFSACDASTRTYRVAQKSKPLSRIIIKSY